MIIQMSMNDEDGQPDVREINDKSFNKIILGLNIFTFVATFAEVFMIATTTHYPTVCKPVKLGLIIDSGMGLLLILLNFIFLASFTENLWKRDCLIRVTTIFFFYATPIFLPLFGVLPFKCFAKTYFIGLFWFICYCLRICICYMALIAYNVFSHRIVSVR